VIRFACAKLHSADETIGNAWLRSDEPRPLPEAPSATKARAHLARLEGVIRLACWRTRSAELTSLA
jgi:hypothetical protein